MCCVDGVLTDAVVPQVSGQALPLVLRVVVPLPLLELLTGQVLVLLLPLRIEDDAESTASRSPRSFQGPRDAGKLLLLTGFLHWAQKLWWQDGQVTFSWSPSLINPEVH